MKKIFFLTTIYLLLSTLNSFAQDTLMSKSNFKLTILPDATFQVDAFFPVNNINPIKLIDQLTENEELLKASDEFVSSLTVDISADDNSGNKTKIVNTKIKILKLFPDKAQLLCAQKFDAELGSFNCEMTDASFMKKKFHRLNDSLICSTTECHYKMAARTKSALTYSSRDVAAILAEVTISRFYIMIYVLNEVDSLLVDYNGKAKAAKKSSFYKLNIDDFSKALTDNLIKLSDGECEKLTVESNPTGFLQNCI